MSPQTVFHPFVLGYTMMSMHGFLMVLAPCDALFLHGLCRSQVPSRDGQRVACGARRHRLRSALHRGPLVARTGHVHRRRQAIVLKTINLNPVRMDQHPRGAPACFEQVLEESLETAPARVHRTNGLARHAALCAILAVGLPVFCSLMTTTCFAHPKTTRRWLAPEL